MEIKIVNDKIEKLEYATEGSAAIDLRACVEAPRLLVPGKEYFVGTGIALNIQDKNIAAVVVPRSSLGKQGLVIGNLVGLIDSDYQGEIMLSLWNRSSEVDIMINPLDRVAQLLFIPIIKPELSIVQEFSSKTTRGSGGFGSTGRT